MKGLRRIFSDFGLEEEKRIDPRWIWYLVLFSLLIRIPLLLFPEVIHNDGTEYIRHARQILSGDWSAGKSHPLYPALIALAHFFSPDFEIAGIWVSVILGTLVVLPVFYLGKAIFNEKVGRVAALFATVHPFLHTSSGSVLTESTFHFLTASSVFFGWSAFNHGRIRDIFFFGFLTSMSYLTRPEGIGFLLIFGVWVLGINPIHRKRRWTKRIGIVLLAIFSFLIFSSPYLIQLKRETGRWQISKKVSVSMGSFEEEAGSSVEMIRVKKEITFSALLGSPLTLLRKIGSGMYHSLYIFQQVFHPFLFLLLLFGFLLSRGRNLSLKGNLYLASYLVYFFGFIHPFFWVTRRYTSHVISFALPWAAFGLIEVTDWVQKRFKKETVQKKFPAVLLIGILLIVFLQGRVTHPREHRLIQKEVGLWMKENLPKGSKVMSQLPQEAFYAKFIWIQMPFKEYEVITENARSEGVCYLLIHEDVEKISPYFWEKMRREDWVFVRDFKKRDQRVVLFEMVGRD